MEYFLLHFLNKTYFCLIFSKCFCWWNLTILINWILRLTCKTLTWNSLIWSELGACHSLIRHHSRLTIILLWGESLLSITSLPRKSRLICKSSLSQFVQKDLLVEFQQSLFSFRYRYYLNYLSYWIYFGVGPYEVLKFADFLTD